MSDREIVDRRSVAYFRDQSLDEIEEAIRETQKAINSAALSVCIAIAAIEAEVKYHEAGYRSMREYLAAADLNLPRQTLWQYLKIGQAFIEHRPGLTRNNYAEEDGIHKLIYINLALETHKRETVNPPAKRRNTHVQRLCGLAIGKHPVHWSPSFWTTARSARVAASWRSRYSVTAIETTSVSTGRTFCRSM